MGRRVRRGRTRQQVALQVLKSTEFRTRLIKGWFQAYLGRQPTDVELNFYLATSPRARPTR